MSARHAKSMEQLILEDGRYPPEAYGFLHEGLGMAVHQVHGGQTGLPEQRHVTGRQLCLVLRDLALERWGQLAPAVLGKWNIRNTLDFGNMVYLLADAGYMKVSETDSIDDFRDVYGFQEVFGGEGEFDLKE